MRQTRSFLFLVAIVATLAACKRSPSEDFKQGVAYFNEGKFAKATGYFEKALQTATPTAQAWNFLGVCRLQTGDPAEAIKAFQACVDLDSGHGPARYNLALAYLESNQPDQAIPPLRYLTKTDQCPPSAYYHLGRALLATGSWAPAAQAFLKLSDAGSNAVIQSDLGVVETHLGNFKQAKVHFENATRLDPNLPAVYLNLAILEHHYLNHKQLAAQSYQKYLDLLPKSEQREDIRLTLSQLTQETVKPVEAPAPKPIEQAPPPPPPAPKPVVSAADLPAVERIEPKPAPVLPPVSAVPARPVIKRRTPVSVTSLKAGDRKKAEAAFNDGISQHQQGKLSGAIAAYGRATSADPSYAKAYYNLAIAYVSSSQPDKALDNYELALIADAGFTDARYNYGITLQKQGYVLDALAQYEKILEKTPKDSSLHLIVATLYARDPQTKDKARQHYQAVQRLTPDTPAGRDARDWLQKNS